ncbi:MAG: hypothetical protein AAGF59_07945 [Pseudomonadota bacterium]
MDALKNQIIDFAGQLTADRESRSALSVAKENNWLDTRGLPTDRGLELVKALEDQQGTRSVFRLTT